MKMSGLGVDQHPLLGTVRYSATDLGWDPDTQVARTVGVMRERVAEDGSDPMFIARAKGVIDCSGSVGDRTQRVWQHVKSAIQFTRDESTGIRGDGLGIGGGDPNDIIEVIIRPVDMAGYIDQGIAIGDCDDFSMYCAALLMAVGVPCSFCTVAANPLIPSQYSHIYVVAYPDGQRVPCDASHGQYCGWEYGQGGERRTEWPVYDKTRLFIGSVVTNVAVVAGLWFGYQYLKRSWA